MSQLPCRRPEGFAAGAFKDPQTASFGVDHPKALAGSIEITQVSAHRLVRGPTLAAALTDKEPNRGSAVVPRQFDVAADCGQRAIQGVGVSEFGESGHRRRPIGVDLVVAALVQPSGQQRGGRGVFPRRGVDELLEHIDPDVGPIRHLIGHHRLVVTRCARRLIRLAGWTSSSALTLQMIDPDSSPRLYS